ncbi:MAG: TonB-dependent receptor [Flavobacteriaceae bacterium]|nr:TonB-dependent receptor [Flavobacteriaceae bacterium]
MKINYFLILFLFLGYNMLFSQEEKVENLDEVIITSSRIDIPFNENSRTITIISKEDILNSTALNVADLLQQFTGVDVRRKGIDGMQSDLYIRGGSFDQTLILIDGIKTEDPQSGHHTMNIMIPIENIERIEVIKGPAARVFGQNAFTGAINIVTKKNITTQLKAVVGYGSYHTSNIALTGGLNLKNSAHQVHISRSVSDGYRYNTDFTNQNYFIKSKFNTNKTPFDVIAMFMERKFGANGFYASPDFIDQYEETQTSLIGMSTSILKNKFTIKPKVYWKRGQDMYLFLRDNPDFFRNLHITNKLGGEINTMYDSKFGLTGFGVDLARVYISSNNLGDHDRTMVTAFLEHRLQLLNDRIDIIPGVAVNYFSDFGFHAFPGIDLGYAINDQFKVYGNIGYTYRIPTYTDLYYTSPTTEGNDSLNPEKALAEELGLKYNNDKITANFTLFYRDANNLIDYVKEHEEDKWSAENLAQVITKGIETEIHYIFNMFNYSQNLKFGYTFLEDDIKKQNIAFSRYSLNSIKHQVTSTFESQFFKKFRQYIVYKFVERSDGTSYNVVDFKLTILFKDLELSGIFNNIFNTEYTETNLVPMPKSNAMFVLKYTFK